MPFSGRMRGGSSTVTPDENKSLAREFYEQWNAGTIDFERLFHRDVTNHQPGQDAEVGLELFRRAIEGVTGRRSDAAGLPVLSRAHPHLPHRRESDRRALGRA